MYAAGHASIHYGERDCIERASSGDTSQPNEVRVNAQSTFVCVGGWGTIARFALRAKTGLALFEHADRFTRFSIQSTMVGA